MMLIILAFIAFSCSDHNSPGVPPVKQRIKTITRILPNNGNITEITKFEYNQGGTLIESTSYQSPDSTVAITSKSYYQIVDGKLIQMIRKLSNATEERYNFTYDSSGKPVILDYDAGNSDVYKINYQYSGVNLVSSNRVFKFSSINYEQDLIYTFTGDNLSKVDYTNKFYKNVMSTSTSTSTFTFDDKINPFYGTVVIPAPTLVARPTQGNFSYYTYFGGIDNLLNLSKNNMLSEITSSNVETTYSYTYNTEGLPTNRIIMQKYPTSSDKILIETMQFEYETY